MNKQFVVLGVLSLAYGLAACANLDDHYDDPPPREEAGTAGVGNSTNQAGVGNQGESGGSGNTGNTAGVAGSNTGGAEEAGVGNVPNAGVGNTGDGGAGGNDPTGGTGNTDTGGTGAVESGGTGSVNTGGTGSTDTGGTGNTDAGGTGNTGNTSNGGTGNTGNTDSGGGTGNTGNVTEDGGTGNTGNTPSTGGTGNVGNAGGQPATGGSSNEAGAGGQPPLTCEEEFTTCVASCEETESLCVTSCTLPKCWPPPPPPDECTTECTNATLDCNIACHNELAVCNGDEPCDVAYSDGGYCDGITSSACPTDCPECVVHSDCPDDNACIEGECRTCDGLDIPDVCDPEDHLTCKTGKVLVCHWPFGNFDNRHEICISEQGWENGHIPETDSYHHDWDHLGPCVW